MGQEANQTVITGMGLASSMGGAVPACAAARAGLTRVAESDLSVDGHSLLPLHRCPGLEGFSSAARLALMASHALVDLTENGLELCNQDTAFFLNLPVAEERPGWFAEPGASDLGAQVSTMLNGLLPNPLPQPTILNKGHAGVLEAVAQAHLTLQAGAKTRCLVGGLDSMIDEATLALLFEQELLKSEEQSAGLIAGEGAAFLLLESRATALSRKAPILATIQATAQAEEDYEYGDEDLVPTGNALTEVLTAAWDQVPEMDAAMLVSDLNGVDVRAKEWGFAWLKCLHHHRGFDKLEVTLPAISFGDTGAAAGGFGLCMAVRALARGYAGGRNVLITGASQTGTRIAATIR